MLCVECGGETSVVPCSCCQQEPRLAARYELLSRVGTGATGVVFRARRETGEEVAIKEIPLHGADPTHMLKLARREARVLRELSHPQVPKILDEIEVRRGRFSVLYLVQEYIHGVTLQQEVATHRYSEQEVLDILREILPVFEYLHSRSPPVIHRDVKPANLIRRLVDRKWMLVDFGSVRDVLKPQGGSTVVGTFGFMSPEQFRGEALPATDIFGLGATAIFLLARIEPSEMHDRDGRFSWESWVSVSESTRQILRSMLEFDPNQRPSAGALRRRLEPKPALLNHPEWLPETVTKTSDSVEALFSDPLAGGGLAPRHSKDLKRKSKERPKRWAYIAVGLLLFLTYRNTKSDTKSLSEESVSDSISIPFGSEIWTKNNEFFTQIPAYPLPRPNELQWSMQLKPLFPAEVLEEHAECTVHGYFDSQGEPVRIEVSACSEPFKRATLDAVRQWRAEPYFVDGEPTGFQTIQRQKFVREEKEEAIPIE